jgi:hypothetical protein
MSTNTSSNVMNLTPEQVTRVRELLSSMRDGTTFAEACERIFDQGLYQLEYRYGSEARAARKAYSAKRAEMVKDALAAYKKAQKDPELAVKMGLGKRVAL